MYSTLCVGVRAICQTGQNIGKGLVLTMKTESSERREYTRSIFNSLFCEHQLYEITVDYR